jgi:predicted enzyme related to lactoylglutathione lyase
MPNIGYFEVPADDVERARRFYGSLLGWRIEPGPAALGPEAAAALHHDIVTGEAKAGTLNQGALYRRQASEPILVHVLVGDLDAVLADVERLGGAIVSPKTEIPTAGVDAIIRDSEGNLLGLWQPE